VAGVTRKIIVPGVPIDLDIILQDATHNAVVAIPHRGEFVVVFWSGEREPSARSMSEAQVGKFTQDVRAAHQAIKDDEAIKELEEREFGES
jgi:hypothetical protein